MTGWSCSIPGPIILTKSETPSSESVQPLSQVKVAMLLIGLLSVNPSVYVMSPFISGKSEQNPEIVNIHLTNVQIHFHLITLLTHWSNPYPHSSTQTSPGTISNKSETRVTGVGGHSVYWSAVNGSNTTIVNDPICQGEQVKADYYGSRYTLNVHIITHSVIPYPDTLELLLSSTLHHSHKSSLTLQPKCRDQSRCKQLQYPQVRC